MPIVERYIAFNLTSTCCIGLVIRDLNDKKSLLLIVGCEKVASFLY